MDSNRKFWIAQNPTLENMFLNERAEEIDKLERPEILHYLQNCKGKKALDLGAGIGRFTGEFAKQFDEVTAVDLNQSFLKENQKRNKAYSNIHFVQSDAIDLELENPDFDLIFASGIFLYFQENELDILKTKLYKWIKTGGYLFFRESLSPFEHPHKSTHAILRPFSYYQELFDSSFTLVNIGSLKSHITLFGDPFRCFWLFRKDPVKTIDKLI